MLPLRRLHVRKYLPISMNTETSTQSSNTDTNRPQRLDEKCISASELQFRKRNKPETDSRLGDAIAVSIIVYESSNFFARQLGKCDESEKWKHPTQPASFGCSTLNINNSNQKNVKMENSNTDIHRLLPIKKQLDLYDLAYCRHSPMFQWTMITIVA